ncbi:Carbohydrate sulfotransferase 15 [Holothuria leucospilota]|uniref:Carbohydrate sulfotransferase 15 n=1 Tax=Holothuria leucospilota TaxID=206669 RepID=A0A9Q1GWX5_HOLLE|nr:Carbohydrate sulfotransferase 15 [Holothuria leucospilota]
MFSVSKRKIIDLLALFSTSFSVCWMFSYHYVSNHEFPCTCKQNRALKYKEQTLNKYSPKLFTEKIVVNGSIASRDENIWSGQKTNSHFELFTMPSNDVSRSLCHNISWDSNMTIRKFYGWDPKVLQNSYLSTYKSPCFYTPRKSLSCLPYFFLAGMPKSGTTDIWGKLIQHPQILNSVKEPHWWSRLFKAKVRNKHRYSPFNGYTRFFKTFIWRYSKMNAKKTKQVVIGDGSVSTFWDNHYWLTAGVDKTPGVLQIIHSVLPKAKFIVAFREPSYRLFSSYQYFKVGKVKDYHRQVVRSLRSFSECFNRSSVRTCTFSQSEETKILRVHINMYSVYVREFLRFFPRDQLFHFRLDEWSKDCPGLLKKLFAFLEIDAMPQKELSNICQKKRRNKTRKKVQSLDQSNETRKMVQEFYKPYLRELAELLDDPRYLWEDNVTKDF